MVMAVTVCSSLTCMWSLRGWYPWQQNFAESPTLLIDNTPSLANITGPYCGARFFRHPGPGHTVGGVPSQHQLFRSQGRGRILDAASSPPQGTVGQDGRRVGQVSMLFVCFSVLGPCADFILVGLFVVHPLGESSIDNIPVSCICSGAVCSC